MPSVFVFELNALATWVRYRKNIIRFHNDSRTHGGLTALAGTLKTTDIVSKLSNSALLGSDPKYYCEMRGELVRECVAGVRPAARRGRSHSACWNDRGWWPGQR